MFACLGVKAYYCKENLGSIFSDEIFYALTIVMAKLLHSFYCSLNDRSFICNLYNIKFVLKCFLKCCPLTNSHDS